MWPILCSLVENRCKVGIVGIYHGETKPNDANVFLKKFINEAIDLSTHDVTINKSNYPFKIKGFICDTRLRLLNLLKVILVIIRVQNVILRRIILMVENYINGLFFEFKKIS